MPGIDTHSHISENTDASFFSFSPICPNATFHGHILIWDNSVERKWHPPDPPPSKISKSIDSFMWKSPRSVLPIHAPTLSSPLLVVYLPLWQIMDFVSWDDDIPNMMESHKNSSSKPPTRLAVFKKPTANTERNTQPACLFWPNLKAKCLPILVFSSPSYWMVSKMIKHGTKMAVVFVVSPHHGHGTCWNHLLPCYKFPGCSSNVCRT